MPETCISGTGLDQTFTAMKYYNITVSNAAFVPPADGADGWGDVILGQAWGDSPENAIENWAEGYDGIPLRQLNKESIHACGWDKNDLSAHEIVTDETPPVTDETIVCTNCGSAKIQNRAWVTSNTNKHESDCVIDESDFYCPDCEETDNDCCTHKQYIEDIRKDQIVVVIGDITAIGNSRTINSISQLQWLSVNTPDYNIAINEMIEDIEKDGHASDHLLLDGTIVKDEHIVMNIPDKDKEIIVVQIQRTIGKGVKTTKGEFILNNIISTHETLLHTDSINKILNLKDGDDVWLERDLWVICSSTDEE